MKATSIHRPEHAVLVALLRDFRIEADMTQSAVAEKLGVAQTSISDVEINERGVDFLLVLDLCRIYGMPIEAFMDEFSKRLSDAKIPKPKTVKRKDRKRP
jgi:transcriptional regulator with XRE-family HTH domain